MAYRMWHIDYPLLSRLHRLWALWMHVLSFIMLQQTIQNDSSRIISERARKIATALFLIADILDVRDPLYLSMRQEAMSLISETYIHDEMSITVRREQMRRALASTEMLIALLHVAYESQLISNMNYSIVHDELLIMHTHLYGQFESLKKGVALSDRDDSVTEIFSDGKEKNLTSSEIDLADKYADEIDAAVDKSVDKSETHDLPLQERPDEPIRFSEEVEFVETEQEGSSVFSDGVNADIPAEGEQDQSEGEEKKKTTHETAFERKKEIMNHLVVGKKYSITELVEEMPHYGRRTMQREVNTLVMLGLVEKEGDRRWSTYRLIK
jgi:hypothetical protein